MPNIKSAKKRVLVSQANYEKNKAYRSALRTAVKKADAAIDAKSEDMAVAVTAAVKKIDQAASKGILHPILFSALLPPRVHQVAQEDQQIES